MLKRRRVVAVLVVLFALAAGVVAYVIYDNNRVVVRREVVEIEGLPAELEGFSVLQITDLQEEVFGKNQSRLLEIINSLSFDVVALTGDMMDSSGSENYAPLYAMLEGIENNEHILFVSGNHDPISHNLRSETLEKSEFIQGIEERGVTFLENPYVVEHAGHAVWFANAQMRGSFTSQKSADLVVGLTRYPFTMGRVEMQRNMGGDQVPDYDLVMAGHYHGGQFRIPFYGALFVPERSLSATRPCAGSHGDSWNEAVRKRWSRCLWSVVS